MNIKRIRELFTRYREVVLYVFFGGCTTLVNVLSYWAATRFLALPVSPATALAWGVSVLFAYVTNRIWVFKSRERGFWGILKEAGLFFLARAATGLMDVWIMSQFVDAWEWPDMPVKIASNIIVIILNYVFSKLLIFRRKERGTK